MIYTIDQLKERVSPIANKYRLRAVYLFGSYARGEAAEDSDLDFLIDRAGLCALAKYPAAKPPNLGIISPSQAVIMQNSTLQ